MSTEPEWYEVGRPDSEAREWLRAFLLKNGDTLSADVKGIGRDEGFSRSAISRAAQKIGVIYRIEGKPPNRVTVWAMPDDTL